MQRRRKKGFTLIELLVVIAIIGILSSVVLASLSSARMKARDARRISDLEQIKIALELYYDSNNNYPTVEGAGLNTNAYCYSYHNSSWTDLSTKLKPYISTLPKDPINSSCGPWLASCYTYAYGNVGDGNISGPNTTGRIDYDLTTQLETPNHPRSCGAAGNNYRFLFNTVAWCGGYSPQLYEASPM